MARPKKIKDCVRISTVISQKQFDWLKHMCIRMSTLENRTIGVSEAIRMAIEAAYPPPKDDQIDMFVS